MKHALRIFVAAATALSFAALPTLAQDLSTLVDRAVVAYNEAVDDENAGRYSDACTEYRDAASRFDSAKEGASRVCCK